MLNKNLVHGSNLKNCLIYNSFDFEEKKESKLTFENVPTMSWIQSTEISGELLFSLL